MPIPHDTINQPDNSPLLELAELPLELIIKLLDPKSLQHLAHTNRQLMHSIFIFIYNQDYDALSKQGFLNLPALFTIENARLIDIISQLDYRIEQPLLNATMMITNQLERSFPHITTDIPMSRLAFSAKTCWPTPIAIHQLLAQLPKPLPTEAHQLAAMLVLIKEQPTSQITLTNKEKLKLRLTATTAYTPPVDSRPINDWRYKCCGFLLIAGLLSYFLMAVLQGSDVHVTHLLSILCLVTIAASITLALLTGAYDALLSEKNAGRPSVTKAQASAINEMRHLSIWQQRTENNPNALIEITQNTANNPTSCIINMPAATETTPLLGGS